MGHSSIQITLDRYGHLSREPRARQPACTGPHRPFRAPGFGMGRGKEDPAESGYVNQFGDLRPRPPLPTGPFLVVGLARSGAAVARLLAGRGERVLGCDQGTPDEAEGLAQAGVEVSLNVDGTALLDEVEDRGQEPRRASGRARDRRGARAWPGGDRRAGARLARDPERLQRRHRDQRQDDHGRAARPRPPPGGDPVAVAGNVGTPLASLAGDLGRGHGRLRGIELPARGHQRPSRPRAPCC